MFVLLWLLMEERRLGVSQVVNTYVRCQQLQHFLLGSQGELIGLATNSS